LPHPSTSSGQGFRRLAQINIDCHLSFPYFPRTIEQHMSSTPFLTAGWRKIILANYAIDAHHLSALIPHGTVLDTYNDTCYVSLVGFLFDDVKIKGIGIPFHTEFPEINLRFYVKHQTKNGAWRRGVVFIKEFVPKMMVSFVANNIYGEHYETVDMDYSWMEKADTLEIEYSLSAFDGVYTERSRSAQSDKRFHIRVVAEKNATEIPLACEAEFITEHYWGYTKKANHETSEYEVWHPRWKTYPVKEFSCNFDFGLLYGLEFEFMNHIKPFSVMLAEGSEVRVMQGNEIK
jgi:uncharacterized protein YqjF (DUF2071 family)